MSNVENNNEYSIIFSGVKKAYGKTVVIENLYLEIKKGERLILLPACEKLPAVICSWMGSRLTICLRENAILPWFSKATLSSRI